MIGHQCHIDYAYHIERAVRPVSLHRPRPVKREPIIKSMSHNNPLAHSSKYSSVWIERVTGMTGLLRPVSCIKIDSLR